MAHSFSKPVCVTAVAKWGQPCAGRPSMEGDFRIKHWLVQPHLNAVVRPNNTCAKLEPRVMEVLVYLADHVGEVVSKEAIFQSVWSNTFVTDDALIRCIVELRKAFEDDVKEPRIIQTI